MEGFTGEQGEMRRQESKLKGTVWRLSLQNYLGQTSFSSSFRGTYTFSWFLVVDHFDIVMLLILVKRIDTKI